MEDKTKQFEGEITNLKTQYRVTFDQLAAKEAELRACEAQRDEARVEGATTAKALQAVIDK